VAKKQRKITIRYEITDGKIRFFDKDNNELSYENTVKGILDCPHIILQPSSSLPPIANKGVFNVHFINQFNGLKSRDDMTEKQWKIATRYEVANGRIQLFDKDGNKLPGKGTKWEGDLDCTSKGLTTFEGMPEWVTESLYCSDNKFTSFEYCPQIISGNFYCYNNKITSFQYCPQVIGRDFWCFNNQFTSFKYCPQIIGRNFDCCTNQITSFKYCPQTIGGDFYCSNNFITNFKYCPQIIGGNFWCHNNQFTSFEFCPQIIGGHLNNFDSKFTSLEGKPLEYQDMFIPFYNAGYILADGILTKRISERKKGDLTIYKTSTLGTDEIIYVAKQGNITAHAETARKAIEELIFKDANRDVSQYQNMPLDTTHTPKDWAFIYRYITGSCKTGVEMFLQGKQLKKTYTLEEILKETQGQYRFERFKEIVQEI
jgi:hypothetical protein